MAPLAAPARDTSEGDRLDLALPTEDMTESINSVSTSATERDQQGLTEIS